MNEDNDDDERIIKGKPLTVPVQGMPDCVWFAMLEQRYLSTVRPSLLVMLTFSKEKPAQGAAPEQWIALAMLYRLVPVTLTQRTSLILSREESQPAEP